MKKNNKRSLVGKIQDFMSSYNGKVILNYAYSWGAAVVILGSLFKLTHLPGANIMLFVGMGTEVLVFTVSAFDKPYKSYKWESVFPQIKLNGAADKPKDEEEEEQAPEIVMNQGSTVQTGDINAAIMAAQAAAAAASNMNVNANGNNTGSVMPQGTPAVNINTGIGSATAPQHGTEFAFVQQPAVVNAGGINVDMPKVDNTVIENMNEATETYVQKLKDMTDSLERFQKSTYSLSEVSDALAASYKIISDNSGNITANSQGYVYQMENLNRNLSGLNTIYEIQLHSISSQLDTIKQVNEGLTRIKEMYENSKDDSEKFHKETELMAKQIEELNAVYARMLQAMTVNMK